MFTGYSALAMAEALPDDGRVVACEVDAGVARFARGCFDGSPARSTRSTSGSARRRPPCAGWPPPGSAFDLVFIDADKARYLDYLNAVLDSGLLAPHGVVCVDNTLMQGQPWTAPASRPRTASRSHAFNEAVAADPRVEQVMLPLRDGLTLIRRASDGGACGIRHLDPMGVEVSELRLADVDAAVAARLRGLLADRGVLVLPGQDVDDAAFLAFLRGFGALAFTVGETPVPGIPGSQRGQQRGRTTPPRSPFHVDTSYVRQPPAYTALRAVRLPERGGATLFSDQYRAYDTLPADVRERLRGPHHPPRRDRAAVSAPTTRPSAEHPVFRPHPLSGRTALYMSTPKRCAAISGLEHGRGARRWSPSCSRTPRARTTSTGTAGRRATS